MNSKEMEDQSKLVILLLIFFLPLRLKKLLLGNKQKVDTCTKEKDIDQFPSETRDGD